jgi:hypothetical protein
MDSFANNWYLEEIKCDMLENIKRFNFIVINYNLI